VNAGQLLWRAGQTHPPLKAHEYYSSTDLFEHFHDICVVWSLIARTCVAALEGHCDIVGIALFEYCLTVPASRIEFAKFSGFQLKVIQEAATLSAFIVFAVTF
jgi:hypothetical protein